MKRFYVLLALCSPLTAFLQCLSNSMIMYKRSKMKIKIAAFVLAVIVVNNVWCSGWRKKSIPMVSTVMVFAPHPDDDVLGCGGAIIKHVAYGAQVTVVYMTSGETNPGDKKPQRIARLREEEARRAAAKLGVHDLVFLREPDSKLRVTSKTIGKVKQLLNDYQPDLVYIPHKKDEHSDHKATYDIVVEGVKKLRGLNPVVLGYEVWSPMLAITHVAEISDEIQVKLDALSEHKTQIADMDFVAAVHALNRYRGILIGRVSYGECFQLVAIE